MTDFWQRLAAAPPDVPLPLAVDPDGHTVYMSRKVWEFHIHSKRPRMQALRDLVIQAISHPDYVKIEDVEANYIHYFKVAPPKLLTGFESSEHEVLVVVKYLHPDVFGGRRVGVISTAYAPYLGEKR